MEIIDCDFHLILIHMVSKLLRCFIEQLSCTEHSDAGFNCYKLQLHVGSFTDLRQRRDLLYYTILLHSNNGIILIMGLF